jgi:proteasome lid subunit RPN8/RPN11
VYASPHMKDELNYVMIDPECFYCLVLSSIEVYNKETTGFLMGNYRKRTIKKKKRTIVACEVAYSLQTAYRNPTSVTKGNERAFERVRATIPSMNLYLLGEYHSHPYTEASLTKEDMDYIQDRLEQIYGKKENLIKNYWLELVISINKKNYSTPHKIGWSWRDFTQKAKCNVKINPYLGYDLTVGGYWVYLKNGSMRKIETTIYISWVKDYWS